MTTQRELQNDVVKAHVFLQPMYDNPYFPKEVVDHCRRLMLNLCQRIETKVPYDLADLYRLTFETTQEINEIQDEFYESGCEIEDTARQCFESEFDFIAKAYGFKAHIEAMTAIREW